MRQAVPQRKDGPTGLLRAPVSGLVAAQYLVALMGAGVLLWKTAQVLWLGWDVTFKGSIEVILVGVLVPGLVWVASREELRLRRDLEKQNRLLEHRARELEDRNRLLELRDRETGALNRLMRSHLANCLAEERPSPQLADAPSALDGNPGSAAVRQAYPLLVTPGRLAEREPSNGHLAAATNGHRRPEPQG